MRYSEGFKAQAVDKYLANPNRSVNEAATELNIYAATLASWIKRVQEGTLIIREGDVISPSQRNPSKKNAFGSTTSRHLMKHTTR